MAEHTIRFAFPEGGVWAGWTKDGALGYAPTVRTAARFDSREIAERTLRNGYGAEIASYGTVEPSPPPNVVTMDDLIRDPLYDNERHSRQAPTAKPDQDGYSGFAR